MTARPLMALALVALLCGAWDLPTRLDADVEEGNRAYRAGDYERARTAYERALAGEGDAARLNFDHGAALYKLADESSDATLREEMLDAAETAFRRAAESTDPRLKVSAYYNLGNTLFQRGRYDDAAGAYRKVLRLDPAHDDARYNLELALRERPPAKTRPGAGQSEGAPPRTGPDSPPDRDPGDGQGPGEARDPEAGEGEGEGEPQPSDRGGDQQTSGEGPRDSEGGEPPPTSDGERDGEPRDDEPRDQRDPERRQRPDSAADDAADDAADGSGAAVRPDDAGRKLRALERRSRELRRQRLRDGARDGLPPGGGSGKDW